MLGERGAFSLPGGQVLTGLGSAAGHNSSLVKSAVPRELAEQGEPLPCAGGSCPGLGTRYPRDGEGSGRVLETPGSAPALRLCRLAIPAAPPSPTLPLLPLHVPPSP